MQLESFCTTMKSSERHDTLTMALTGASGLRSDLM